MCNRDLNESCRRVLTLLAIIIVSTSAMFAQNCKPHVNIGTIGHWEAGKTTLTYAISYIQSGKGHGKCYSIDMLDDAPEEKERGRTVYTSKIEYETDYAHYVHYDCPGHKDNIEEGLEHLKELDGVILVIDATSWGKDMHQPIEYLLKRATKAKVSKVVVFLSKCDMMDNDELLKMHKKDIRKLLINNNFSKNTPILHGSALGAVNNVPEHIKEIENLLNTCDRWIARHSASASSEMP